MAIKDFVVDNDIDLIALTGTWLRPGITDEVERLKFVIYVLLATGFFINPKFQGGGVNVRQILLGKFDHEQNFSKIYSSCLK